MYIQNLKLIYQNKPDRFSTGEGGRPADLIIDSPFLVFGSPEVPIEAMVDTGQAAWHLCVTNLNILS